MKPGQPQVSVDHEDEDQPTRPVESLRREVYAILFLYAVLTALPFLLGWLMAP